MQAIIYCRVSSDTAGQGRSVGEQEKECRAFCEREHFEVVDVLVDNDKGASRHSRKERPEYARLPDVLEPGMVLVTWEASRAQRDLSVYTKLRDLCAAMNVKWAYSGTIYDLNTGDGRFTTGLHALLAENEAEKTRERVLRAMRANAAEGKPHGKVPYGYRMVKDPHNDSVKHRVQVPEQAAIIREAVSRILAGETTWSVAQSFNQRGVPTPGTSATWNHQRLTRMVKSPTHAGLRSHGGIVTAGLWEPIVTVEEHEAVVALLSNSARRTQTGTQAKYLLTGIATCGVCGTVVERIKNSGYESYTCSNPGRHVARRIPKVDHLVSETVIGMCEQASVTSSEDPGIAEAQAEASVLRARLEAFYAQAEDVDNPLSPAALARFEKSLLPRIEDAERRARPTFDIPELTELYGPNARARWELWGDLEKVPDGILKRRAVVRALLKVTILPASAGRRFMVEDILIEQA